MELRRLRAEDRSRWDPLWQGYLEFYEESLDAATTDRTWDRLTGDDAALVGLGAFVGDELVGICHLVFHASTWSTDAYCYLEDLFVRPDARGDGVGRALIDAAVAEARVAGAFRLYWQTKSTNATARRLYDRVADDTGFIVYAIESEAISPDAAG